jgi:hypothetical protein
MVNDLSNIYQPIIRHGIKIDGITGETIPNGAIGKIIQKSFITSYDKDFERVCNNVLLLFLGNTQSLDRLLVVIKKNEQASIYQNFPIKLEVRLKNSKKALEPVYENEIVDISGVEFSDAVFNLDERIR